MKLYITRHGQTDWNLRNIIQGRTDIALNETGRMQARKTRDLLKNVMLDQIITSPLQRAKETACIINELHHVPIREDLRVIERAFGDLEGADIKQIDFSHFWCVKYEQDYPTCERTSQFFERVHAFIDSLKDSDFQSVLVVAHGGVSLPFYTYFHDCDTDGDMRRYMLDNCEVACYEW